MFRSTTPESDSVSLQFNTGNNQEASAAPVYAEPSKRFVIWRRLIANLWQRLPRFDAESMYKRDERDLPSPDPRKPTSLSARQIADIWLLNSKH
jgi:hypothetical protein